MRLNRKEESLKKADQKDGKIEGKKTESSIDELVSLKKK